MNKPITEIQATQIIELLEQLTNKVIPMSDPMTVDQAAKRWSLSEFQIRELCKSGAIIAYKIGMQWRIPIEENEVRYANK